MKNKRPIVGVAVALVAALFCCVVFWLGGFNFDHRSTAVALGFLVTSLVAAAAFWRATFPD